MLTEHLFEQWHIDEEALLDAVRRGAGECDVFLGGSLADDLGNTGSDIDLYCFLDTPEPASVGVGVTECGGARVELHVVGTAAGSLIPDLTPLVSGSFPGRAQWPFIPEQFRRVVHALYRDRALARHPDGPAERLRRRTGADLLHIHNALWATAAVASLAEDAAALTGPDESWSALYCARLAVEAALDAALACHMLVNPNPKWRVPLAFRARLLDQAFPDPQQLLAGLFPDASSFGTAVAACLAATRRCLGVVTADAYLASFDAVPDAAKQYGVDTTGLALWLPRDEP
ncbi:MAG TPA: hypothetical protein VFM54_08810 [Micromonosporaceae bacterium]|nr:hypothetical protein [Micromonosporaceae bacterium]